MTSQIITPDYVIELNQDYTISNHGIHKRVCSYYRKNVLNSSLQTHSQTGGFIRGGTIFPKNCRKYFTPSALRYLEKYSLSPNDILSAISNSYNPEYYNSNRTDDLSDYFLQMGGRKNPLTKEIDDIEFKEDYSGDKIDKRLVYLISISNKPIVVKISQAKEHYLTEKRIYRYFNKIANSKDPNKYDSLVDKYIYRTYETQDFTKEYIDQQNPYILLPCELDGEKINLKLSNDIVPKTQEGQPFLSNKDDIMGTYNYLKTKFDSCLYIVMETRPTFFIFKDYVKDEADPSILKRIFYKTANLLKYFNQIYGFNHWDLHYHNLMVYVSPKKENKPRKVNVCFFDFDLAAVGNNIDTNVEAYRNRLKKYIKPTHNLYKSYRNLLEGRNIKGDSYESDYMKKMFETFETFLNNPLYKSYNLDEQIQNISNQNNLEKYFKYMGRIHDIIRLVNIGDFEIDITEKDVHKKIKKSIHTNETKTNIELIIIYNLMRYANLKNHEKLAYATLIYTDFFLYLRKNKVFRKTILKL
jgi:hypothetical protein